MPLADRGGSSHSHDANTEVLVITTPWCHHCKAIRPQLDRLATEYSNSMRIEHIDAAIEPDCVGVLGVRATPTLILRVAGVERARLVGRVSNADLEQFFATHGNHRPFPLDGIIRTVAGLALVGIGWGLDAIALVVIGALLTGWATVTMWRWWR